MSSVMYADVINFFATRRYQKIQKIGENSYILLKKS